MWSCNLCSLKSSRRGNIIRHIGEKHGLVDPQCKNTTKDSGAKPTGKISKSAGRPMFEKPNERML